MLTSFFKCIFQFIIRIFGETHNTQPHNNTQDYHQLENHVRTQITDNRERERYTHNTTCRRRFVAVTLFVSSAVSSSARMKTTSRGGGGEQQHRQRLVMMKLTSKKNGKDTSLKLRDDD